LELIERFLPLPCLQAVELAFLLRHVKLLGHVSDDAVFFFLASKAQVKVGVFVVNFYAAAFNAEHLPAEGAFVGV
jgi:uncharacterized Fe-S radical SAM superfamily protein PflX